MSDYICPICGSDQCTKVDSQFEFDYYLDCNTFGGQFSISEDIDKATGEFSHKLYNLIFERMLRNRIVNHIGKNVNYCFFYDDSPDAKMFEQPYIINLANDMKNYPSDFMSKMHRVLLNLSVQYRSFGDDIYTKAECPRLFFCESENPDEETDEIMELLSDLGLVKSPRNAIYFISADGWKKIDELTTKMQEENQGFIAMKFGSETENIRMSFKKAIGACGYKAQIIDEKEHNNQIVPEIFYEIRKSKFLVVDVTYPSFGAYYEAGYAQALGKQVIVCCSKEVFDSNDKNSKPHFDISQQAMIVWGTLEELEDRLTKRIRATVNS